MAGKCAMVFRMAVILGFSLIGILGGCAEKEESSRHELPIVDSVPEAGLMEYHVSYTWEQLMTDSTLVVRGRAVDADLLTVDGVGGGTILITEYQVEVEEVLRGDLELPAQVAVQRTGNPEATEGVIFADEPTLRQGEEYLLFLQSRAGVGGSYNTQGDHYFVLGSQQGVWESAPSTRNAGAPVWMSQKNLKEMAQVEEVLSDGENGTSASETLEALWEEGKEYPQIQEDLARVNSQAAPDEGLFRQGILQNLETNQETGFLTQEEARQALEEMDQYATVTQRVPLWEGTSQG